MTILALLLVMATSLLLLRDVFGSDGIAMRADALAGAPRRDGEPAAAADAIDWGTDDAFFAVTTMIGVEPKAGGDRGRPD